MSDQNNEQNQNNQKPTGKSAEDVKKALLEQAKQQKIKTFQEGLKGKLAAEEAVEKQIADAQKIIDSKNEELAKKKEETQEFMDAHGHLFAKAK